MALVIFLQTAIVNLCLALFVHCFTRYLFTALPASIPRVRDEGKRRFSLRTRWAYYTDCRPLYKEAYEKYSKIGKTCILPFLGFDEIVMIPLNSLRWLGNQPDHIINSYEAFIQVDNARYTAPKVEHLADPWQGYLVKTQMNRVLENLALVMEDELAVAFDQRFGKDLEWKELILHKTMRMIIAQTSSRFTVGTALCRNEAYLKDQIQWGELYILNGGIIGNLPYWLKPLIAPFVTRPQRLIEKRTRKLLKPIFEERVAHLDDPAWKEPQDHFQMMIRYAQTNAPKEFNNDACADRMQMANLGSMHMSSYATTNLILDIVASDRQYNTINILREEVTTVLAEQKGAWTKATIAKLVKVDSAVRESMRLYNISNRNVFRKVVARNGVTTEDGVHLPYGTIMTVLTNGPQTDGDKYETPEVYDPFRFSRLREQGVDNPSSLAFVSLSSTNLPFGSGKHACPGRFLFDFEIKMLVTYLIMTYDIELAPEYGNIRPESPWICEATFPPKSAKVRVRRKEPDKVPGNGSSR